MKIMGCETDHPILFEKKKNDWAIGHIDIRSNNEHWLTYFDEGTGKIIRINPEDIMFVPKQHYDFIFLNVVHEKENHRKVTDEMIYELFRLTFNF